MRSRDTRHAVDASPGRLDEPTRAKLVFEFRSALDDLLDAWFPRVIDREHGGFLCDFDHRWRPTGPHRKMLEFQARQARLAAMAAQFLPDRPDLLAAAEHGFAYLRDAMWDDEFGGFYRLLDRAGNPLEERSKHGHGTAYAISACVAHHRLTGSDQSLDLARRGFDWMEQHAHDKSHGGYYGYYLRDGRLILDRSNSVREYPVRDPIGTPLGLKDVNTTKDLMETMGQLAGVWPDPRVLERLREMLDIVRHRVVVPPGSCHVFFNPDWRPIPDIAHYGHNLHMASLLLTAAAPLGPAEVEKARLTSRQILDCALEHAWDPVTGGFAYAGSTFGPIHLEDHTLYLETKYWWPQAESLVNLVHFAAQEGTGVYSDRAVMLWRYIQTHLIDTRYGGWFRMGLDAGKEARRQPKADLWRDGSHEGMALIKCIRILEAITEEATQ
jgi:cellobiose epimerase